MAATSRRTRTYKEKGSGFTFGHFALPVAAVIALALLFVGIKLFFLMPAGRIGIEVVPAPIDLSAQSERNLQIAAPLAAESEPAEGETASSAAPAVNTSPAETAGAGETIVLAGPIAPNGTSARVRPSAPAAPGNNSAAPRAANTARNTQPAVRTAAATPRNSAGAVLGANGKWAVQIGAFVKQEGASTLLSEVEKQGYVASISKVDSSGKTFHRVRVNAGGSREDAAKLAAELERKGYPVAVVPTQ
jgi:cell division septation protein DedD